jgi:hypothetical protein
MSISHPLAGKQLPLDLLVEAFKEKYSSGAFNSRAHP